VKIDADGRKYVTIVYNEMDKNKGQYMFARPNDPNCPVRSFELYINKLNPKCEAFLQRPDARYKLKTVWFVNAPLGIHTISNMLKNICQDSGVANLYTNHCIKATTANGFEEGCCCYKGHYGSNRP
jgi:hypothetical protein